MNQTFDANYYRSIEKTAIPVRIQLNVDEIIITEREIPIARWSISYVLPHRDNDNTKVYLSYPKSQPVAHLEVDGQNFNEFLNQTYPSLYLLNKKSATNASIGLRWIGYIVIGIAILVLGYQFLMPKIIDQIARKIPFEYEQKIGKAIFTELQKRESLDSAGSIIIQEFFDSLHWDNEKQSRIYLSNSDVVNAFALPGGNIIVYKGLLEKMDSYPELAALLGHEFGHVQKRHIFRGMLQSLSTYVVISLFLGDITGVMGVLVEQSNMIYNLKYSRSYEKESDDFSFNQLKWSKIDPHGLTQLFRRLVDSSHHESEMVPEFLSTHPGLESRIASISKKIEFEPYPVQRNEVQDSIFLRLQNFIHHQH